MNSDWAVLVLLRAPDSPIRAAAEKLNLRFPGSAKKGFVQEWVLYWKSPEEKDATEQGVVEGV